MDTFCVLPWFGREINWNNDETHCCLLPRYGLGESKTKSYDIEKIKTEMLQGQKPEECKQCWQLEEKGLKSERQMKNSALDWYWDKDLQFIKQEAMEGRNDILILKLFTSYSCNSTCVSCDEKSSSSWSQLNHRMFPEFPIKKVSFADIDIIKQKVNFKELKMLSFVGGEPLYEKRNFELLEYLLELGNDTVFLSMVTNGSVQLTDHQKGILSRFKNVNFSISIDGVGPVFEYLRFPLKWQDLLDNLNFFRQITDNISSNFTLSNLNALYYMNTVSWFTGQKIPFNVNPIAHPHWLQPRSLPMNVKKHIQNIMPKPEYLAYIGTNHSDVDQHNWNRCLERIGQQDLAKGIDWKNYLPQLHKVVNF